MLYFEGFDGFPVLRIEESGRLRRESKLSISEGTSAFLFNQSGRISVPISLKLDQMYDRCKIEIREHSNPVHVPPLFSIILLLFCSENIFSLWFKYETSCRLRPLWFYWSELMRTKEVQLLKPLIGIDKNWRGATCSEKTEEKT